MDGGLEHRSVDTFVVLYAPKSHRASEPFCTRQRIQITLALTVASWRAATIWRKVYRLQVRKRGGEVFLACSILPLLDLRSVPPSFHQRSTHTRTL